jgi:uncharacterized MAPEG superfamily protein
MEALSQALAPFAKYALPWQHVLFAAALLTYLPHLLLRIPAIHAKLAAGDKDKKGPKGYDIRAPRTVQAAAVDDSAEGRYIARLNGHHANSHEVFPILLAGVLGALQRGVAAGTVNGYATAFLASRVLYTALYIGGTSAPAGLARAGVWTVGLVLCLHLLAFA